MQYNIFKSVRLPRDVVKQIEKIVKVERSTFSQFMRTAAMNELSRKRAA